MLISFLDILKHVDALIQQGEGGEAQKQIEALFREKLSREEATGLAALAWRAGLPLLGMRALAPYVRPASRRPAVASPAEKIEYAACLVKLGAPEEALKLVEGLEGTAPKALLIRAFALISRWDYAQARPVLTKYVRAVGLKPYDRLVGKINLVEALIHEKNETKALSGLREVLHDTSLRRLTLMQGKTLELSAQYWIGRGRYAEADKQLHKAELLLSKTEGMDLFFVKKWKAVSDFLRTRGNKSTTARLNEVREEALERKHWETVRQCDQFKVSVTEDPGLLRSLYFGTPHDAFRKELVEDLKAPFDPGTDFVWQMGAKPSSRVDLDLTTASAQLKGILKPESLLHRTLMTLTSDFYRPFRVASLFASLYPEDFYHPDSSPARVHEAVKRLREWLSAETPKLSVLESDGSYRLVASGAFAVRVPLRTLAPNRNSTLLSLVRAKWPDAPFSVTQVSHLLDCSPRSALTQIKKAVEKGQLGQEGKGPTTRYRLVS